MSILVGSFSLALLAPEAQGEISMSKYMRGVPPPPGDPSILTWRNPDLWYSRQHRTSRCRQSLRDYRQNVSISPPHFFESVFIRTR